MVAGHGGSDLRRQVRHGAEQVGDEAEVGDLEDRGVLVLVDRDDRLRILHARKVLDRARNADREIDLRGNDLAGLADLIIVGDIARVDRGARSTERSEEHTSELQSLMRLSYAVFCLKKKHNETNSEDPQN